MAPTTFGAKADADACLANVRTDIGLGRWIDVDAARERFDDYSRRWLDNRHDLRPRTRELYESELKGHLVPAFGKLGLSSITTARVRTWNAAIAQRTPVIDLARRTIAVTEQAQRVSAQGRIIGPPKSDAGNRSVAIPGALVAMLDDHMARVVGPEMSALVFGGERGGPLERSNWSSQFAKARRVAELNGLRSHDLRHRVDSSERSA